MDEFMIGFMDSVKHKWRVRRRTEVRKNAIADNTAKLSDKLVCPMT
jgi:hypothetical protein